MKIIYKIKRVRFQQIQMKVLPSMSNPLSKTRLIINQVNTRIHTFM